MVSHIPGKEAKRVWPSLLNWMQSYTSSATTVMLGCFSRSFAIWVSSSRENDCRA